MPDALCRPCLDRGHKVKAHRIVGGVPKCDGVAVDLGFTDGTAFSFLIDIRPAASAVFFKTGQDAEGFGVSFQEE